LPAGGFPRSRGHNSTSGSSVTAQDVPLNAVGVTVVTGREAPELAPFLETDISVELMARLLTCIAEKLSITRVTVENALCEIYQDKDRSCTMDFFIEGQTSYDFRPGANGEYLKFTKAWGKGEKWVQCKKE
jgi:hypothetical protein